LALYRYLGWGSLSLIIGQFVLGPRDPKTPFLKLILILGEKRTPKANLCRNFILVIPLKTTYIPLLVFSIVPITANFKLNKVPSFDEFDAMFKFHEIIFSTYLF
jgi:hypothetical protein